VKDSTRTIEILDGVHKLFRITREFSSANPDSFEVIDADLDGDGVQELVVPLAVGWSNGMGVSFWTVYVLSPGETEWRVDSLPVEEYSTQGSWIAVQGERRCNLLQTSWVKGFEPRRGWGLYLEARWQTLEMGHFIQRMDRPVIRRRFLVGFAKERSASSVADAPFGWLRSSNAKPWTDSR